MPIILKRILAGIIDFYIICFAATFVVAIVTLGELNVSIVTVIVYLLSVFVFMVFKDKVFRNASIGKKIFRIRVFENNKNSLTIMSCIKRNVTLVLIPIEIIFLSTTNQRLGDMWAKTTVTNTKTGDGSIC